MFSSLSRRLLILALVPAVAMSGTPAEVVYRQGQIYTADAANRVVESLAISKGRIVYVGDDAGVTAYVGPKTEQKMLSGAFVMPGLVDGHMHPMEGGVRAIGCSLHYAALTVAEFRQRLQQCLDADRRHEPDGWLEATNWFQQAMLPAGTLANKTLLDSLNTQRPILVLDAFGHTVLANSRALAAAHITKLSVDMPGGRINRDANGEPNGLLEDGAYAVYEQLIPPLTAQQYDAAARAALAEMASQGITTALDADTPEYAMHSFQRVMQAGGLTARVHFAPEIQIADIKRPAAALRQIVSLRKRFDGGTIGAPASLTLRNAKLYLDGVIAGPAFTGAVIDPYFINDGTPAAPHWVPGLSRGPEPYFPAAPLAEWLIRLGRAGIDPHLHVDGDRAVRAGLDGVEAMRQALPGKDIRVGLAHDELVHPDDFPRFQALGVYPVLSFQWQKPAPDTLDQLKDYLGPARFSILEPAGLLLRAGAPVAYGSDWPVDALNPWFAFKVAVTRENDPATGPAYAGRLGDDPGLSRLETLRAMTVTAARELHCDDVVGSLELGKLADLVVLDRSPLTVEVRDIANVKVIETVLGGKTVFLAH